MDDDSSGWFAHNHVCISQREEPLKMFMTVVGKFYSLPIGKVLCREVYRTPGMDEFYSGSSKCAYTHVKEVVKVCCKSINECYALLRARYPSSFPRLVRDSFLINSRHLC